MGYYIENTKTFHVVLEQLMRIRKDCKVIGQAWKSGAQPEKDTGSGNEAFVAVTWEDGTAHAEVPHSEAPVQVEYYQLKKEVFSRNQGILEYDQMSSRQAVIAGAGSGGAFVALEFAKAGIGSLVLADDDRLAYHNICRHPCGIHDVGKYKVDAVAERIADINPACQVYIFRDKIQHVDPQEFENVLWKNSILLCCSDNRHAGYVCNELADRYHIPMVDAGCGPRASTGEIFYYKPDCGMPCYTCTYGEDHGVDYTNQAVRRRFYATETELEKLHFQPGMYLDIQLTAIFEAKLAIDLLMENEKGYEAKLLPYINQCTVLLNYPMDQDVNPYMNLFGTEAERRPFTWKSGPAQKNGSCSYCGAEKPSSDIGCNTVA